MKGSEHAEGPSPLVLETTSPLSSVDFTYGSGSETRATSPSSFFSKPEDIAVVEPTTMHELLTSSQVCDEENEVSNPSRAKTLGARHGLIVQGQHATTHTTHTVQWCVTQRISIERVVYLKSSYHQIQSAHASRFGTWLALRAHGSAS